MGFFGAKSEREQYDEVVTKMKKKLELAKKINELNIDKIYTLTKQREVEDNQKKLAKIEKQLEKLNEELAVMKTEMIKAIIQGMELFEIEDDDGTPMTQQKLQKREVHELIEYLTIITEEMEKIT